MVTTSADDVSCATQRVRHRRSKALPVHVAGSVHVTGFDLDMTLIDSRPGIKAVYDQLSQETGVCIDSALVVTRLGPPTEVEMANWFPPEHVGPAVRRYREIYTDVAVERTAALPGAADAVAAARERGRVVVVTAKASDGARRHLEYLQLEIQEVYGQVWRDGKAEVLRRIGADVFVGDHTADMAAAQSAGAVGVGVTTGPCSGMDLIAAGADRVLASLHELPGWFGSRLPPAASDRES
jgi:phosphoglycolate phosphatase